MSPQQNPGILQAIRLIEDNGLKIYRPTRKDRGFMKIYSESLEQLLPKISGNALKVFMALGGKLGWENTVVEMTRNEIMESTSLSEKTVQSALNELEELKVISRIGPNNRRKYVLSQMYVKKGKSSKK